MLRVGIVGWRGMVGSVLVQRMREEGDFAHIEPLFFSTSQAGGKGPDIGRETAKVGDATDIAALKSLPVIISCQGGDYTNEIHPRLRQAGWKIRPRALTLTLFARLALGDVFIHGLGGALYDKITDGIFERLFRVQPPEIILASCTVYLPVEAYPSTPRDLEAARRRVRDWRFNPDRLLAEGARSRPEAAGLIDEKRRLIREREPTREGRRRAWRRVRAINELLAVLEPEGPRAAAERLARVERELKWNAILRNREYPICFYPAEELAAFYHEVTRM